MVHDQPHHSLPHLANAAMASPSALHELLAEASFLWEQNKPLMPMYLHLVASALFPIYTGAHASLSRPSSAAKPLKRSKDDHDDEDDEDEDEEMDQKMEGLTPRDAILFPVTAGIVLAGLYFAIKRYGADLINLILGVYFSLIGTFSVGKLINDSWSILGSFVTPTYYHDQGKIWKVSGTERKAIALDGETNTRSSPLGGVLGRVPLPYPLHGLAWATRDVTKQKFVVKGFAKNMFDFRAAVTRHNAISGVLGIAAIAYTIMVDKPWWLTNLQGFAVSYGALQLMSPTTFATATLILSGLFFYDIWAVFFTPLMVTVAKNLDVPIKLVFPRPEQPSLTPGKPPIRSYSMLGLGDIVLPGLMIALALRFDLYLFYLRKQKKISTSTGGCDSVEEVEKAPYVTSTGHWGDRFWTTFPRPESSKLPAFLTITFSKTYFTATMVGYVIGMIATLVFMSVFQHAQPALLYLVPAVLTSFWGTGLVRGELKEIWEFSEGLTLDPVDEDEDKAAKEKKEKTPVTDKSGPDAPTTEASAEQVGSKSTKSNEVDDQTLFSFRIARHGRKGSLKSRAPDAEAASQIRSTSGSTTNSESVSDDTVVISSDDVAGAEDIEPQHRVTIAKDSKTHKKARLE